MPSLIETLTNHQLCKLYQASMKDSVLENFTPWVNDVNFNDWHLSLYKFAIVRPLQYYDDKIINTLLSLFEAHKDLTFDALSVLDGEMTHAILSLLRKGNSWENEARLSLDNPKDITEFELTWHPEYQRYSEHIFNFFIRIPLYILGKIKNKDYLSPPLSNRVEILSNNNLNVLAKGFNSIIRNAISHGSIAFKYQEIKYSDRDKSIELTARKFSQFFDDLVDSCHSFLIGILLFLCNARSETIERGLKNLPLSIRQLFINSVSSHAGFEIVSMVESQTIKGEKQLNVYCKTNTLSRYSQLFDCMSVAWHTIKFGGEDYNRLALLLDCNKSLTPSVFLNADRLREAIAKNESLEACLPNIIETSLLWYDVSILQRKIDLWKNITKTIMADFKKRLVRERQKRGLKVLESQYSIRYIENKSTEKISRIEAHVILKGKFEINVLNKDRVEIRSELIEDILTHIVCKLKKFRVNLSGLQGEKWIKRKPSHIWIRLYIKDLRIRTHMSSGWQEKNLIVRAEWFSRWRNDKPLLVKQPHVIFKRIFIEYNPEIQRGTW